MPMTAPVIVNDRVYPVPGRCAVVICLDGCEPEYLDVAVADGRMPTLHRMRVEGTDRIAHSVIPSFTNPNNLSIATGRPPSVHGICGNYFHDPSTGTEVMMNDVRFLRAPTIFSKFFQAVRGLRWSRRRTSCVPFLPRACPSVTVPATAFSSERAGGTTVREHGIEGADAWVGRPVPEVYSADLSEFVLAAGVKLLEERQPDLMYLSTTDYIQHKHAPDAEEALTFHAMFDRYLADLDALGAVIVVTADHGMKAKHGSDGEPSVIYVQDVLDGWLGIAAARVVLPITDPYVVHHGALGSFATAYLPEHADREGIRSRLAKLSGMVEVTTRETAAWKYELPSDRIGDLVMISDGTTTLGTSSDRHDLSALGEPLRSHGGLTEQAVPFIVNRRIDLPNAPELRNFDAFFHATTAAALE